MRSLFFFAAACLCAAALQAQTPTAQWNGKTYFVYPHQEQIYTNQEFFAELADYTEVLERDAKNREVIKTTVEPISRKGESVLFDYLNTKQQKKLLKTITELTRKYPEYLYTYNANFETEITPALETLPDGEYIQYYRDLPYLDKKTLRYRNTVVAGVFTLKNNRLEGPAKWLTASGQVVRSGSYTDGARTGTWQTFEYQPKELEASNQEQATQEFLQHPQFDTICETVNYGDGLLNGPYSRKFNTLVLQSGAYKNDKKSGSWEVYDFAYSFSDGIYKRNGDIIKKTMFTIPDQPKRGKSIIIRGEIVDHDYARQDTSIHFGPEEYVDFSEEFSDFSEFYTIVGGDSTDDGLELTEEEQYEDAESDMLYYDDFRFDQQRWENPNESYHYINGHLYTRNELIDSIGYVFEYEGIYEEYYDNGQLKLRFEIRDGSLVSEDTVFWNNGQAANVVNFLPDSNLYEQLFFDYNGKQYKRLVYTDKGNVITEPTVEAEKPMHIGGLDYYIGYGPSYTYSNEQSLLDSVTERTLLEQEIWKRDSTISSSTWYYPETRTLDYQLFSVDDRPLFNRKAVFDEDFNYVRAEETYTVGNLQLQKVLNGPYNKDYGLVYSFYERKYPNDTLDHPHRHVINWREKFELTTDDVLYQDGVPFTGTFNMSMRQPKYVLESKPNAIQVRLPDSNKEREQVRKALKRFYKKGKTAPVLELYNTNSDFGQTIIQQAFNCLEAFSDGLRGAYNDYGYEYDRSESGKEVYDKTVSGTFANGKLQGEWVSKNNEGEVTAIAHYNNGLPDGTLEYYATAEPLTPTQLQMLRRREGPLLANLYASLYPKTKTRYLYRILHFRNGLLHGAAIDYQWNGDTVSYYHYKDGDRTGKAFERNPLAYMTEEYRDDMLHGIKRTYVTIPGKPTFILHDLNFQNGTLQGESKAYHINGKLAKRGFFLYGQPIDDYQAYDTLGNIYQYVKFQYGQPIEEKIWEENQLSVRYTFDWRDSIPFNSGDIAESSSLESLIYELALERGDYLPPYYGRPSLVDKDGIDYGMTKYYPNDTVAREGQLWKGKKVGCWKYYSYEGRQLYEVDYFDTLIVVSDSVRFKSKGVLTYVDAAGNPTSHNYIIEKIENYDCSHTDHYEERMLYAFWEKDTSEHRINGYVKNYYDNGALQNEGLVKDGLPTGVWKLYDNSGHLSHVGEYRQGKRQGRWLSGDLSQVKYMGDICLNPNLPNLEEIMAYQEKLLDISVVYYKMGVVLRKEFFGINMNSGENPEDTRGHGSEGYYDLERY